MLNVYELETYLKKTMALKNNLHKIPVAITLSFLFGGLSALSMAPTNYWFLLPITIGALYYLIHLTPTVIKASIIGLFFGFGYFGFGLYWIGNALLVENNPYKWAWPLAVCGLPLILAPFYAFACLITKAFKKDINSPATILIFSAVFTLCEYLRGHLFTGFPWNLFGYTWADIPAINQIAAIESVYFLTFMTILWSCAPVYIVFSNNNVPRKTIVTLLLFSTIVLTVITGAKKLSSEIPKGKKEINFVLIQPNIPQNEKWDPDRIRNNFMNMLKDSEFSIEPSASPTAKATYIIWPETAIYSRLLDAAWARTAIANMLNTYPHPAYLISGAQRYNSDTDQYFNSIIIIDRSGTIISTYDKSHLVPFGEYMPLSNIIDIAPIVGFSGFEAGLGPRTITMPEGVNISPLICYEILFPGQSIDYNLRPDIIINVTNDAWYGNSPGPYQHLTQAQFRAIENNTPVIRVANTGVTALFDRHGNNIKKTRLMQKEKLIFSLLL